MAQSNPTNQQALDEPTSPWSLGAVAFPRLDLAKRRAKQDFQRQTSFNRGVTELLLPTALAAWRRGPNHFRIKPDRQRSALLQAVIVRRPIRGLILRGGPTAYALSYHPGVMQ